MENNMQTNTEHNHQKTHITSDTSFTPDKNSTETPMTDHSLNESENNQQSLHNNTGDQTSGGSNRDSGYEIEEDIEIETFSPCSRKM